MGKSIIAALVCLPLTVHAEQLLVEYAGTVSSIERGSSMAEQPPYSVGDSITGTLLIDTVLAPRDTASDDPHVGRYYRSSPGLDFILGPAQAPGRGSADRVLVHDDWDPLSTGAPREDGMIIKDSSIGEDGEFNLLLGLSRPNSLGQIFSNDSLAQTLAVERAPGTNLWGHIERGFGEFWRIVNFTLDRLSVKPGACRA
jgi:hypothetical protein